MKYKNLIDLKEQRPQLVKKLLNWGLNRKYHFGFVNKERLEQGKYEVEKEISEYLDELVLTPSSYAQAKDNLIKWDKILTEDEKQAVGLLITYDLPQKERVNYDLIDTTDSLIANNWYDGTYKVLAEKVLDIINYKSKNVGLITENSYGASILNTEDMLIIDIDLSNDDGPSECNIAKYPEQAINALKVIQDKEGLNFRVYQTAGGLRVIETTKSWNPTWYTTKNLMKSVYADPLYIALCRSQECFRARLTPKPWRLFDCIDYDNFTTGKEWLNSTEKSEVAVCKLLEVIGLDNIDSKFKPMIEYHDKSTKALDNEAVYKLILV